MGLSCVPFAKVEASCHLILLPGIESKAGKVSLLAGNGDLWRLSHFLRLRWLLREELVHGVGKGGRGRGGLFPGHPSAFSSPTSSWGLDQSTCMQVCLTQGGAAVPPNALQSGFHVFSAFSCSHLMFIVPLLRGTFKGFSSSWKP